MAIQVRPLAVEAHPRKRVESVASEIAHRVMHLDRENCPITAPHFANEKSNSRENEGSLAGRLTDRSAL